MVKISIIIPVYNLENYLEGCLDCVCSQSLRDIEIICVDDGSTDNSLNILEEKSKADSRIKVLTQKNMGAGAARNNGIQNACGEFIAFMDADDFYPNEFVLEKMYNAAKENGALICGGSVLFLKNNVPIKIISAEGFRYCFYENKFVYFKDYQFDYGYWRFIYNRKFLEDNQLIFPLYLRGQDPPFFIKAMLQAEKFYALVEPTYAYRLSQKRFNLTDKKISDQIESFCECIKLCRENGLEYLEKHILNRVILKGYLDDIFSIKDKSLAKQLKTKLIKTDKIFKKLYFKHFLENIFSVKTIKEYLIFTFCSIKIKIKSRKLEQEIKINELREQVEAISQKTEYIYQNLIEDKHLSSMVKTKD